MPAADKVALLRGLNDRLQNNAQSEALLQILQAAIIVVIVSILEHAGNR